MNLSIKSKLKLLVLNDNVNFSSEQNSQKKVCCFISLTIYKFLINEERKKSIFIITDICSNCNVM